MVTVDAGPDLFDVITLAYNSSRSLMLHGPPGVGKSEIVEAAAKALGVGFVCIDLSLMEPPDLIGLPRVNENGRTTYASPSFLPRDGKGILLTEELNRAPRYMRAPCLQLLTARRLNDYVLPDGWVPFAAVNDAEDGCDVDDLDPALLSRFSNVRVEANRESWLAWAKASGVDASVVDFVRKSPKVFASTSPRSWQYVSDVVVAFRGSASRTESLLALITGFVGNSWATSFLQTFLGTSRPLEPKAIVDGYEACRATVVTWVETGRIDLVAATLSKLTGHLSSQRTYSAVCDGAECKRNIETFFSDLPADLIAQTQRWLDDRAYDGLRARRKKVKK